MTKNNDGFGQGANYNSGNYGSEGSVPSGNYRSPDETAVFGATGDPEARPHQVFPESPAQSGQAGYDQAGYNQPGYNQPGYDQPAYAQPAPGSYTPPPEKKSSTATVAVLSGLLALAVIGAGIFALLFMQASNRPEPVPATETLTTTAVTTTTAIPTDIIPPLGDIPSEIPTEIPTDVQQQLDELGDGISEGADKVQGFLDEILGELESQTN